MVQFRQLCVGLTLGTALFLGAACSTEDNATSSSTTSTVPNSLDQARRENLSHNVNDAFPDTPVVLADAAGTGIDTVQYFFNQSDTLIIAEDTLEAQLRAASLAVVTHAPMLTMTAAGRDQVISEIDRLQASYVLTVGKVQLAKGSGDFQVIQDPGTAEALASLTALEFQAEDIAAPAEVVPAVAALDPNEYVELVAGWSDQTAQSTNVAEATENIATFPVQSRRDADTAPIVVASYRSGIADIASARSFGATVRVMSYPDPRYSAADLANVVGLEEHSLVALGADFGTDEVFANRIAQAGAIWDAEHQLATKSELVDATNAAPETTDAADSTEVTTEASEANAALSGTGLAAAEPVVYQEFLETDAQLPELAGASAGWIIDPTNWELAQLRQTAEDAPRAVLRISDPQQLATYEEILTLPQVGVYFAGQDAADYSSILTQLEQLVAEASLPQKEVLVPADAASGILEAEVPASDTVIAVYLNPTGGGSMADLVEGATAVPELPAGWMAGLRGGALHYGADAAYPWNLGQHYLAAALQTPNAYDPYPWVIVADQVTIADAEAAADVANE